MRSLEEGASFYQEVLGLRELERHHAPAGTLRSIWLDVGGQGFLALERVAQAPEPDPAFRDGRPGVFLVAFRIDAAERARVRAELERRGIALVHETKWTLYVRDQRATGSPSATTRKGVREASAPRVRGDGKEPTSAGTPSQPPLVGFSSTSKRRLCSLRSVKFCCQTASPRVTLMWWFPS